MLHTDMGLGKEEHAVIVQKTEVAMATTRSEPDHNRFGNPNSAAAGAPGRVVRTVATDQRAVAVLPVIEKIKATGAVSCRGIAAELNARGLTTARVAPWDQNEVFRMTKRGPAV